jgi:hypothetical protein
MELTFNVRGSMEKAVNGLAREMVSVLGAKYGFDAEEAMREMNLGLVSGQKRKERTLSVPAPKFPLPFSGEIRVECCQGVKMNRGLYTQCRNIKVKDAEYCANCGKQGDRNGTGEPDNGNIKRRKEQGDAFCDPKGRKPVHFTKIMDKFKVSVEDVQAEAAKFGIVVDEKHFKRQESKRGRAAKKNKESVSDTESGDEDEMKAKKARGRPKREEKVVEVSPTEDLFATLVKEAKTAAPMAQVEEEQEDTDDIHSNVSSLTGDSQPMTTSFKGSAEKEAKAMEKAKRVAEKEAKLAEKAKKQLEKEARAAEMEAKAAEKAAKAAERAAKALEKAKKEEEKATKAAEKAALAAKKEGEKKGAVKTESKQGAQKRKQVDTPTASSSIDDDELESESDEDEGDDDDDDDCTVHVTTFIHEGVKYLKSSTNNILYSATTSDIVGKWNEKTKKIELIDVDSDEEEEDD